MAYGPLNLKPWEFGRLQPGEFLQLLDGYTWRQERAKEMQAYFTAASMSVHTKKVVSPMDLLKPLRKTIKRRDKEQDEEYLRKVFKSKLK